MVQPSSLMPKSDDDLEADEEDDQSLEDEVAPGVDLVPQCLGEPVDDAHLLAHRCAYFRQTKTYRGLSIDKHRVRVADQGNGALETVGHLAELQRQHRGT